MKNPISPTRSLIAGGKVLTWLSEEIIWAQLANNLLATICRLVNDILMIVSRHQIPARVVPLPFGNRTRAQNNKFWIYKRRCGTLWIRFKRKPTLLGLGLDWIAWTSSSNMFALNSSSLQSQSTNCRTNLPGKPIFGIFACQERTAVSPRRKPLNMRDYGRP